MRYALLLLLSASLIGCTETINLKNARTGATASCGPYFDTWTTPEREARCISDYQRQGYERTP